MDDTASKENPPPGLNTAERRPAEGGRDSAPGGGDPLSAFNKIDLSQLQGFSFGTQWTQDKSGGSDRHERAEPRTRREDRHSTPEEGAAERRDRRAFRKPDGAPGGTQGADPGVASRGPGRPELAGRRGPEDRRPRFEPRERAGFPAGRGGPHERAPYDSPYVSVTFYPEDASFAALVKTIRASCRTIELFEIARTVLGKPERFSIVVSGKAPISAKPGAPDRSEAAPAAPAPPAPEASPPTPAEGPSRPQFYMPGPDGLPFESEEAALGHVFRDLLRTFFELAEVEVEAPKGNFQVINRCGISGELLGPPNYHRYGQIVQQHFAAKGFRMPFEAYRARIETVRDPEVVNQWLEKMKKITRYTWKGDGTAEAGKEVAAAPAFDSFEEARTFVLAQGRDRLVRTATQARFHGREIEALSAGEIRHAVEGALERQRRFPLDTANALRGRLRREHFTIFKKGAKGISYVCAVKRKFRVPGQAFAESIGALLAFIEAHSMVKAGELVGRFLGVSAEAPARAEPGAAPAAAPTTEQREKIARLQGDLLWLVREGYVTEFIDGSLFAPPPMAEARKKEAEQDEHDPENFPEAPAVAPAAEAGEAGDRGQSAEAAAGPAEEANPPVEPAPPTAAAGKTEPSAGCSRAGRRDTGKQRAGSVPRRRTGQAGIGAGDGLG